MNLNSSLASLHLLSSLPMPIDNPTLIPITPSYLFDKAIKVASPETKTYSTQNLLDDWGLCQQAFQSKLPQLNNLELIESFDDCDSILIIFFSAFILMKEGFQKYKFEKVTLTVQIDPPSQQLLQFVDLCFVHIPESVASFFALHSRLSQHESLHPKLKETTRVSLLLLRLLLRLSCPSSSPFFTLFIEAPSLCTLDRARSFLTPWHGLCRYLSDPDVSLSQQRTYSHLYYAYLPLFVSHFPSLLQDCQAILQYLKPTHLFIPVWDTVTQCLVTHTCDTSLLRHQVMLLCTAIMDSPHIAFVHMLRALPLAGMLQADAELVFFMLATCAHQPWELGCALLPYLVEPETALLVALDPLDLALQVQLRLLQCQLHLGCTHEVFRFVLSHMHLSSYPRHRVCEAVLAALPVLGYARWEAAVLTAFVTTTRVHTVVLCLLVLRKVLETAPRHVRSLFVQRLTGVSGSVKAKNEVKFDALMYIALA